MTLRWRCLDKDAWQEAPMERVSAGQPLFSASIAAQLRCEPWDGTAPAALLQVARHAHQTLCAYGRYVSQQRVTMLRQTM